MRLISRHPLKFITLFIISSFMNCSVVFAAQDGNIKQQTNTQTPATTNVTVKQVLLVRHAEKSQINSQDPQLSAAGMQRAQALAEQLASVALSQLIASDYQRTQLTLAPLAKEKALTLTVASTKSGISAHIKHIVALVKQEQGNSLIAGHSNTLPLIISALGGPNIGTISESSYGGIYQLQLKQNGKVILTQSHFGQ
ncbi:histidine phosphatase family protein [Shewanella halifaxensis]|uniref:histidine phosphatase family protein n=1 Tax=Shewanella halifaxensis TaxID=271098 RepID=UPI000D5A243A|nr:histidine phosphatase family protein [Shewanella halifaxensis]